MKLNLNCEADYFKDFIAPSLADVLFKELIELVKKQEYVPQTINGEKYYVHFGKIMFMEQDLIDDNKFPEAHWGPVKKWTLKLKEVKKLIEKHTNQQFQICVLIYYPDGTSGVDFHSDYTAFGDTSIIPSISLGEEREFILREKTTKKKLVQTLENGSLIIMGEGCQENYEHSLPVNPEYKNERINLTFRKYGFNN